jgi:hypothetical protein
MNLSTLYQDLARQYGSQSGEMVFTFSDKGSMHSYIEFYERYFEPWRGNVSLLEIGMMTGGSMQLWQRYFHKYFLVGMDLSPAWSQSRPFQAEIEADPDIKLIFGVNSRVSPIPEALQALQFDFVIDDGDHTVLAQMDTFQNYWPRVGSGGTYFIEDVIGPIQVRALQNFLSQYQAQENQRLQIEHYQGFKNGRADDQILAVTRT